MRALILAVALCAAILLPGVAAAAPANTKYVVQLARVADEAYRVWLYDLVFVTSGCLSLTLGDDVVYDDATRQLIFPDGQKCYVRGIYRPSIYLRRVAQDLYEDNAGQGYLQTRYCYVYAYGEQVILLPDAVIFLNSGQRCAVAPL